MFAQTASASEEANRFNIYLIAPVQNCNWSSLLLLKMISVDRTANNTTASLTYIVLEQSPVSREYMPRSADDVTSVISMLSSSEMGQRMGYNVLLPARGMIMIFSLICKGPV